MCLRTNMDTELEEFILFLWIFPLIPLFAIFVLCLCYGNFSWILLMITLIWFAVWGNIFRYIHTEICFDGKKIALKLRKRTYVVSVTDIIYIEEKSFLTNPFKAYEYKVYIRPNLHVPHAYLFIRNKKIQKNLSQLFPDVPVKRNVVLD